MLGNDVVDLLDADSDPSTFSARFDQRVFSARERERIAGAADPRSERWCIWAAKEAAFKLRRKQDPDVVFSPIRFAVELAERARGSMERTGSVLHEGRVHAVKVWCDHESVHALSARAIEAEPPLLHGVVRLDEADPDRTAPDGPGRVVRQLALCEIARALGLPSAALEIRPHRRVPMVYLGGRPADVDLSLSHHGALVAWAFRVGGVRALGRLAS